MALRRPGTRSEMLWRWEPRGRGRMCWSWWQETRAVNKSESFYNIWTTNTINFNTFSFVQVPTRAFTLINLLKDTMQNRYLTPLIELSNFALIPIFGELTTMLKHPSSKVSWRRKAYSDRRQGKVLLTALQGSVGWTLMRCGITSGLWRPGCRRRTPGAGRGWAGTMTTLPWCAQTNHSHPVYIY